MGGTSATTGTPREIGTPDPPPPPPTVNVAQPLATVTAPNLRVLPWAGFAAAVSYSFDDTQPSQAEHWEELNATGVPMTFFCNPNGSWQAGFDATWTAVAAAGHELGNHTYNHCNANLGNADCKATSTAEDELDSATDYIKTHFSVPDVVSFAAPYGDTAWNPLASSRFLVGRGVQSGMVPATGVTDWYNLPVFPVVANQTETAFNAAIDSAKSQGKWNIFMFHSILPTTNNWYAGVDISGILSSITYAKSLGDVWLDTMGAVGAYVRGQQVFESVTPTSNTWTWSLPAHFPPGKILRVTLDGGTLTQRGTVLGWDNHGYYEVALDVGELTWKP